MNPDTAPTDATEQTWVSTLVVPTADDLSNQPIMPSCSCEHVFVDKTKALSELEQLKEKHAEVEKQLDLAYAEWKKVEIQRDLAQEDRKRAESERDQAKNERQTVEEQLKERD